ncbi:unnamed protein product, partial [Prorocentrum cordatum]
MNMQVRKTIDAGLVLTDLFQRTPPDAASYFVEIGNFGNDISARTTFVEGYAKVNQATKGFLQWRKDQRDAAAAAGDGEGRGDEIDDAPEDEPFDDEDDAAAVELGAGAGKKKSQKGYERDYRKYIAERFKRFFGCFEDFRSARAFMNKIESKSLAVKADVQADPWECFKGWMNQHCVFSNRSLKNSSCFYFFDKILAALVKHDRVDFLIEIAKLAVPTNDGTPWILRDKGNKDDLAKLALLFQTMETSKLFVAAQAPKEHKAKVTKAKPKGKAKGKAKGRGRGRPTDEAQPEHIDEEKFDTMTAGRKTVFIDDVINAIAFTTENIPREKHDSKFNSRMLAWCFEFGMEGVVALPDLEVFKDDKNMAIILEPTKVLSMMHTTTAASTASDSPTSDSPPNSDPATSDFDCDALRKAVVDHIGKGQFKEYDNWRKLRTAVKKAINNYYACAARADDDDLKEGDQNEHADTEVATTDDKKGDAKLAKQLEEQGMKWQPLKRVLKVMTAKPALISSISSMISSNSLTPNTTMPADRIIQLAKRMHKAFSAESSALFRSIATDGVFKRVCAAESADVAMFHLVELIAGIVYDAIDADAISLLRDFYHGTGGADKDKVSLLVTICPKFKDVITLWRSRDGIDNWMQIRTIHTIGLLEDSIVAINDVTDMRQVPEESTPMRSALLEMLQKGVSFICATLAKAGALDIGASDKVEWTARWVSIIKQAQILSPIKEKSASDWTQIERGIAAKYNGMTVPDLKELITDDELKTATAKKVDLVRHLANVELTSRKQEDSDAHAVWGERVEQVYCIIAGGADGTGAASAASGVTGGGDAKATASASWANFARSPTYYSDSELWQALAACARVEAWLMSSLVTCGSTTHLCGRLSADGDTFKKQGVYIRPAHFESYECFKGCKESLAPTEAADGTGAAVVPCIGAPPLQWKRFYKCGTVGKVNIYVVPDQVHMDFNSTSCVHAWAVRVSTFSADGGCGDDVETAEMRSETKLFE